MLSIISAVHNQLGMNQLFAESLRQQTHHPYELIVVDNHSTDGSLAFWQQEADVCVALDRNHAYPYSQNRGIEHASHDYLAFLNNDLLLSSGWDAHALRLMETQGVDILSFATNDHLESKAAQRKLNRRWKRIKYPLARLGGTSYRNLRRMVRWMYGDFDAFCAQRYAAFGDQLIEGYSGSCLVMHRRVLDLIGPWDERIQAGDWDLFNRAKLRSLDVGDLRPIQLALGVYLHHFRRLTYHAAYEPMAEADQLISLEAKWGTQTTRLRADIDG
jgi:glycosyltransferase involved in cell wall biosynthesis